MNIGCLFILNFITPYIRFIILTLFILLLSNNIAHGQNVSYSNPEESNSKTPYTTILAQNKNGLFVLRQNYRQRRRNILIEKFSPDLKSQMAKEFLNRKDEYLLQIIVLSSELNIFYAFKDKINKTINLSVKRIDADLNPIGKDSILLKVPEQDIEADYIQVIKTRNAPYTLILAPRIKAEVPTEYSYMVIDTFLNLKSYGDIDIDMTYPYLLDQVAYTENEIAILSKQDIPKKIYKDGFHYVISYGKYGQHLLKNYPLYNDSINVSEGVLKNDLINHSFTFTGLYYLKDSGYSKGYYIWNRNHIHEETISKAIAFTPDLLKDAGGIYNAMKGIPGIKLSDVVLRKDGGIILVAEEYRFNKDVQMEQGFYGGGMPINNFRYFFYYNNLIVISLNKDGNKDWHHIIKKEQVSMNDNGVYSSYLLHVMADKLTFAFNDLSRNRWLLSSYSLNAQGEDEAKVLIHPQEYVGKIIPRDGCQVSNSEFVMPGFTEKGTVIVRIKL